MTRRRGAVLAAILATALPLGVTGCGLADSFGQEPEEAATPDEGPERARARVQAYLDAMKEKSVDAGREQFCEPVREAFDAVATSANGDFAKHFTVSEAEIIDIRAKGPDQEVSTSITVKSGGRTSSINLLFTVARADGQWCIAQEVPGGHTPAPSASETPAG
ncbi:hypothetical protein [Micromonospora sp. HM5-17]|uniref:hypothetical protein n=1 Tax=Micromonospora sp. HM5-17 TaxID=2487710 RepID=UPI001F3DA57E|nr:hypothetical protein [Micromonospora sp. HM5-17]